jgi:hypothetical protein
MAYDIIGDIQGYADKARALLAHVGCQDQMAVSASGWASL